jgi:hypothetical protein
MTWHKETSANSLRDQFPKEALKMETDVNLYELKTLGIQKRVKWSTGCKSVTIIMEAKPNHRIRLSPVDKGTDGYFEWMTFIPPQKERPQTSQIEGMLPDYSLRAFVEIIDLKDQTEEANLSRTMTGMNMQHLLKSAIASYKFIKNIEIDLVTVRKSRK